MIFFTKQMMNKFLILTIALISGLSTTACDFANANAALNKEPAQTKQKTPKAIEIPSGVKNADYTKNPAENNLLLTLNSEKQIYYQDKLISDAMLKDVLKEFAAKTKKLPPKKSMPAYLLGDDQVNPFYLKADVELSFSEVVKLLKIVQESSPNEYRLKFIVNPAEEILKNFADTKNPLFVLNLDLEMPAPKTDAVPRPNPLTLIARLDAAGKVKLNSEPPMEISALKARLTEVFKLREQNGVFVEGTNEIEKKIILLTESNVKYGDAIKFIDELYEIGAKPVVLGDLFAERSENGSGNGR